MKYLLNVLILTLCISCYSSYDDEIQVTKLEQTFVNAETLKPIEGMKVYLKINRITIDSTITNKNGYYSFDLFSISDNREYQLEYSYSNQYQIANWIPSDYNKLQKIQYLTPLSWLKIHIVNTNPVDEKDEIVLQDWGSNENPKLVGKTVDFTHFRAFKYDPIYKRPEKIAYTTTKNGISTFKSIPITMKSFDTTFVKITY